MNIEERKNNFLKKLKKIHNDKIELVGDYVKNNEKTTFLCKVCNKKWECLPMTLVRTNRPTSCPYCYNKNKITNTSDFIKIVKSMYKNEYTVLGEYKKSNIKIKMRHNKCKNEYLVRPNDFQQGYQCPFCSHGHSLKTNEEFINEIKELVGDEYTLLENYKGCEKNIKMRHNKCNNEFSVKPRNFLSNGTRCPYCKSGNHMPTLSKAAMYVNNFLDTNKIIYKKEVTIQGCKFKRLLKFDYYLEDFDLYLEVDGLQHFSKYKNVSLNEFNNTRKRDFIKNNFCKENNKKLLRINYKNYKKINLFIEDIKNKRSTTIEKYNAYFINKDIFIDNNEYADDLVE